ncbi:MAG: LysR family transcriptional regulator [Burkholderiaceae bacterium]|jgi:DNA-binding transcriptional LysR family regulator|uniref:LysR family transcriptional regulator n=1 Tax=Cupriavidus metallidurans TaxID=119219 RepID=A0A132HHD4_9BURK|nr:MULTISPECIES: LysR family transcriptional regulator [Cupriavidus]PCH54607.1 MAG: LysR family transcriptional regulator [Burkholderiaceae bacterium]KWR83493.1 LysR family transcriptional regulator [Cupriavidus sp. SHE]KWW36150.1 HTH-type transcriptional activator AllS [Cupriavidus metallidurans]QBP08701.1 LysR family transcriptional regulator [Cupriavidus metallidurans]QWC89122.1 LysR family transcriptional regulator [Cupriavidus metallidurans]
MSLSLEQLQAFAAAAETGSFSAAARQLGKAQSVVSAAVANLEIDLGNALFDRTARYPVLTPAGERLLVEARVILERCEHFRGVAKSLGEGVESRLTLAVDELYPEETLGVLLDEFSQRFPSVELELLFPLMEDVSRLVLSQCADLGIMWRQEILPPELGFHALGWVPMPIICAPDHPLAAQPRVDFEELKRYRQLMVATRSDSEEKKRLRVAAEVWWVESQWVIVELVKRKLGWAFVPWHVAANSPAAAGLVSPQLTFQDQDWPVAMEIVWHKQRPLGKAATWLRERVSQQPLPMPEGR